MMHPIGPYTPKRGDILGKNYRFIQFLVYTESSAIWSRFK
mgnify:CR=1 FL=1